MGINLILSLFPFPCLFVCMALCVSPETGADCHSEDERYAKLDQYIFNQSQYCRSACVARLHSNGSR